MVKRILIIEDNFEIREGTAEILELTGDYEVLTAPDGRVGVELATKHRPDIILCDIMMPELDGYCVLYMLSKNEHTADIPFIFLTAKSERADIRKAMEMGADDYLTKPFDDIELLNAIESRLRKREKLSNLFVPKSGLHLSEEEQNYLLQDLVKDARVKVFKKKQLIYESGDSPIFVYYMLKGKVRSFLYYQDGRELSTGIHVNDQFFGYESILLNEGYNDNAAALEDCEIALIPKEKFFELLYNKPIVAGKFIKLLSGNVREKEEQMLGFAYDTVRKRVANALVNVAEKSTGTENAEDVVIRISRDDLAALAGTANETISRMLADFKDEKLITKEGNAIRIFSVEKLKNIRF
ncbi:response regulator [Sphingobacterium wenxiniae]|uniref:cAMP-binding domain of CRP or a regulatory subunit of cAMP-dependent protein kinases n=1 Tax=Sphingobacterium wenxiniae TaxID=683125 RepID=A0A1I6VW66_9SPHI|nr:response regulator [Sphingobacterium wenxiniae]SFT17966.1 cAMP-binding domain of CRP or a regulatory subunit of cAMP-dependent protein kinases [Sphingobacterium wenxiniae]